MDSYDVRFWDIRKLGNGSTARFRVRWAVGGREHCKSFKARPLADGFLDGLKDAVRDRRPFNPRTGLPDAETIEEEMITWYAHARAYAEAKWPNLAPVSRRSVAEALVTVSIALSAKEPSAPEGKVLRQALFAWAFNPATRDTDPPPEIAAALDWAERASLPVADLEDTATVRLALGACARNLTGKPAAGSTQRRKRSVFYNALGYAVEQGHLPSNPVDRIQWTTPAVAQTVDRRVVVSPAQARTLLAAVRGLSGRGEHLEAFYACLYYAALRPSEAVMLRESDLHLPARGWGRIVLAASASRAGTAWTDEGTARQERGLKHRAEHETRTIPIPPELVKLLRAHIKRNGTTPDGRIFQTARGGILQDSAYGEVWTEARKQALTAAQCRSPLGRRPYDLRHAAVSLWLNSGVPATEVARRAGHGVAVLLKIYAHCIDGQADAANKRITDALGAQDTQPGSEPGDEGDDDIEQAS
jgi:integrase